MGWRGLHPLPHVLPVRTFPIMTTINLLTDGDDLQRCVPDDHGRRLPPRYPTSL